MKIILEWLLLIAIVTSIPTLLSINENTKTIADVLVEEEVYIIYK